MTYMSPSLGSNYYLHGSAIDESEDNSPTVSRTSSFRWSRPITALSDGNQQTKYKPTATKTLTRASTTVLQRPNSFFRPLIKTRSILKRPTRDGTPTSSTGTGTMKEDKSVAFSNHVQVKFTKTLYERSNSSPIYTINFWKKSRVMHFLAIILFASLIIAEMVILITQWGKGCTRPIQYIYIGDIIATSLGLIATIMFATIQQILAFRRMYQHKKMKIETLSEIKRMRDMVADHYGEAPITTPSDIRLDRKEEDDELFKEVEMVDIVSDGEDSDEESTKESTTKKSTHLRKSESIHLGDVDEETYSMTEDEGSANIQIVNQDSPATPQSPPKPFEKDALPNVRDIILSMSQVEQSTTKQKPTLIMETQEETEIPSLPVRTINNTRRNLKKNQFRDSIVLRKKKQKSYLSEVIEEDKKRKQRAARERIGAALNGSNFGVAVATLDELSISVATPSSMVEDEEFDEVKYLISRFERHMALVQKGDIVLKPLESPTDLNRLRVHVAIITAYLVVLFIWVMMHAYGLVSIVYIIDIGTCASDSTVLYVSNLLYFIFILLLLCFEIFIIIMSYK